MHWWHTWSVRCVYSYSANKCLDGSSEIKLAWSEGDCEEEVLMCTARSIPQRYKEYGVSKICLGEKFLCDNFIRCEDGKYEEKCEQEYEKKRTFPKGYHFVCRSPYLNISNEKNETGKFFPMRAIRWVPAILLLIFIIKPTPSSSPSWSWLSSS